MKILLPKTHIGFHEHKEIPVFFLAGPTQGGGDWQLEACMEIGRQLDTRDFLAVVPCRYKENHYLRTFTLRGENNDFKRQASWKRHYLRIASTSGCILFWLPEESKESPRNDGKPYAMDTRGEIGEWRGQLMQNFFLRVVVGGEEGFPGLSAIKLNFEEAIHPDFPIYENIPALVSAAIAKAYIK